MHVHTHTHTHTQKPCKLNEGILLFKGMETEEEGVTCKSASGNRERCFLQNFGRCGEKFLPNNEIPLTTNPDFKSTLPLDILMAI